MEVVEPSVAPYMHLGRQDQLHAPLDWHTGIMDPMDDFLDFSTGVENDFVPQMEDEAREADPFAQRGSTPNYGWNNAILTGNENVQPFVAQYNAADFIIDTKTALQPTVTAVEVTGVSAYTEEQVQVDNGIAMVPFNTTNIPQAVNSWREGAEYDEEGAPLNPTIQHTTSFTTMLVGIFENSEDLSGTVPPSIPQHNLHDGLGISEVAYQDNALVDPPLLIDEMPQHGYARITDTPSLYGSTQPDNGEWAHPVHNSYDSIDQYPAADPALADIEGILFSQQAQNTSISQAQQHHFTDSSLLALPATEFQGGQSSHDGPVTHLSPRTPQTMTELRITPSPNFQIFGMPEPIFDHSFQPMSNAFPPLLGCVPPPQSDMMNNFNSGTELLSKKRKRKAFNNEDKRKVNLVRENGACVACHARKVSVSS